MKYLISGKHGQLGRAFIKTFEKKSIDFIAPEEATLAISSVAVVAESVELFLQGRNVSHG